MDKYFEHLCPACSFVIPLLRILLRSGIEDAIGEIDTSVKEKAKSKKDFSLMQEDC